MSSGPFLTGRVARGRVPSPPLAVSTSFASTFSRPVSRVDSLVLSSTSRTSLSSRSPGDCPARSARASLLPRASSPASRVEGAASESSLLGRDVVVVVGGGSVVVGGAFLGGDVTPSLRVAVSRAGVLVFAALARLPPIGSSGALTGARHGLRSSDKTSTGADAV